MKQQIRVLSVRQPWAHAIVHGCPGIASRLTFKKKVENRSRRTHYRGTVYIHASGSLTINQWSFFSLFFLNNYCVKLPGLSVLKEGAIIGHVDIVDCNQSTSSIWYMGPEVEGKKNYAWILKNPVALETPIPMKGKLGIWKAEIDA